MPKKKPFEMHKDLKTFHIKKSNLLSGRLSEIISNDLKGKNRFMKINQPTTQQVRQQLSKASGTRSLSRFKNPILNRFDFDGEEDYQPKQFYFDFVEESKRTQPLAPITSRSPSVERKLSKKSEKITPRLSRKTLLKRSQTTRETSKSKNKTITSRERIFNRPLKTSFNNNIKLKQNSFIERGSRLRNLSKSNNANNKEIKLLNPEVNSKKIDDEKVERVIEMIEKTLGEEKTSFQKDRISEEEKLEYFKGKNDVIVIEH